jgi:hypothetical protein
VKASTGAGSVRANPALTCAVPARTVNSLVAVTVMLTSPAGVLATAPPGTSRKPVPGARCHRTVTRCLPLPVSSSSTRISSARTVHRRRWPGRPGRLR